MATILGDVQYSQVMGHLPTPEFLWILTTSGHKAVIAGGWEFFAAPAGQQVFLSAEGKTCSKSSFDFGP